MSSPLAERIQSFPQWHYEFELQGEKTPIFDKRFINRHKQRKAYFFDPLVELFQGSLRGSCVLDLGCNAGFWSLQAIQNGCDYVLGIDGRPMHIEQANLVFEAKGIARARYDFRCANVFDIMNEDLGEFDLVLCLGLLYHTCKPFTLLEWVSAVSKDLLLIDTSLSLQQGPVLELVREELSEPRNACDHELVAFPSRSAVQAMTHQLGYQTVMLEPRFDSYVGAEDYQRGERRAFLCAKTTSVSRFESNEAPQMAPVPASPNLMNISTKHLARQLLKRCLQHLGLKRD